MRQGFQTGNLLKIQLPGALPRPTVSYSLSVKPETSVFLTNSLADWAAASSVPIFGDHKFNPVIIMRKLRSREGKYLIEGHTRRE